MRSIPLLHANFAHSLVSYLKQAGCPVQKYLGQARLPGILEEPVDGFVSMYHYYQLMGVSARHEGIDNLGLLVAQASNIEVLGSLGEQLRDMPTLYAGLNLFCHRIPELVPHTGYWLSRHERDIWFCRSSGVKEININHKHPEQYALSYMVKVVRLFAGPDWRPQKVWLQTCDRRGLIDNTDFKDAEIHLSRAVTAINLSEFVCTGKVSHEGLTPINPPLDNFTVGLRHVLKLYLQEMYPNIEVAAELTCVSVRTLKRRLAEAGLTYRGLIKQVRFEQACSMLETTDASIIEIANELSYETSSNFARAFGRWAGMSPSEFRLQRRQLAKC